MPFVTVTRWTGKYPLKICGDIRTRGHRAAPTREGVSSVMRQSGLPIKGRAEAAPLHAGICRKRTLSGQAGRRLCFPLHFLDLEHVLWHQEITCGRAREQASTWRPPSLPQPGGAHRLRSDSTSVSGSHSLTFPSPLPGSYGTGTDHHTVTVQTPTGRPAGSSRRTGDADLRAVSSSPVW